MGRMFVCGLMYLACACSSDGSGTDAGTDQSSAVDGAPDSGTDSGIDGAMGQDSGTTDSPVDVSDTFVPGVVATRIALSNSTGAQPIDAVPSSNGSTFYFIGTDQTGTRVFSIPSMGGSPTALCSAGIFSKPVGITIADDDKTLYIADSTYGGKGSIFVLPSGGGSPTQLGGSNNFQPHGIVMEQGTGYLFFTGIDANNQLQGAFRIPSSGGGVLPWAENFPLTSGASGITLAAADVWIADLKSMGVANLVRISMMNQATPFMAHPNVGAPTGIATKLDGSALLLSIVSNGSDALLEIDLPGGQTKTWSNGVSNTDTSPTGLHRAKSTDVYSWCDHGNPGALYRVVWN